MRGRIWALGLLLVGCSSELAQSARVDQLGEFRRKLESAASDGKPEPIDAKALREVAVAVASRELKTNTGRDAELRVVEVAACATSLRSALEHTAERGGAAGALAVSVLIDADSWCGDLDDLVERYADDKRDEWRAVGVRAAASPAQSTLRAKGFLDPDLRVRRAALRAAKDARAEADLSHLAEVARLDPDRVSRRLALEVIANSGKAPFIDDLRELWHQRDDSERLDIVAAWQHERAFAAGGERQLNWVMSAQNGLPKLAAAVALLARGAGPVTTWAEDVLVEALESGSTDEARYLFEHAPRTERLNQTFKEVATSEEEGRSLWAAKALVGERDKDGIVVLRKLAKSPNPDVADEAKYALAAVGERDALQWLDAELSSEEPERRFKAATVRAGKFTNQTGLEKAAPILADSDASVRTRFACWILSDGKSEK
jgi:hypothetical protein